MSRISRKMRNSAKPGSTPERESKMRLLKPHSNTSEGPGYEATKTRRKVWNRRQRRPPIPLAKAWYGTWPQWYLPLNIHHTTLDTETWLRSRYFLFCQESLKKKKGVRALHWLWCLASASKSILRQVGWGTRGRFSRTSPRLAEKGGSIPPFWPFTFFLFERDTTPTYKCHESCFFFWSRISGILFCVR